MLVICFFGMLTYFVYNAGMISFLMVQHYEVPIHELRDILQKTQYQLLMWRDCADEAYFSDTSVAMYREIWSKTKHEGGLISGYDEGERLIKSHPMKVLFAEDSFEGMFDSYPCEIVSAVGNLGMVQAAFPFNNNSSYIDLFSYHVPRIIEVGLGTGMGHRKPQCSITKEETFRSFGYEEVFSVFVMIGIGFWVAIINCTVEFICYQCKTKDEANKITMTETTVEHNVDDKIE